VTPISSYYRVESQLAEALEQSGISSHSANTAVSDGRKVRELEAKILALQEELSGNIYIYIHI
jgi:hypothetical protein